MPNQNPEQCQTCKELKMPTHSRPTQAKGILTGLSLAHEPITTFTRHLLILPYYIEKI